MFHGSLWLTHEKMSNFERKNAYLEAVESIKDHGLGDEVGALGAIHKLPGGGHQEDGPGVAATRALHGGHGVVLHLVEAELDLVPVDGVDGVVVGVCDQVVLHIVIITSRAVWFRIRKVIEK